MRLNVDDQVDENEGFSMMKFPKLKSTLKINSGFLRSSF
jgi:hypothetical protein